MHLKGNTSLKLKNDVLYCKDVLYGMYLKCFVYNVQIKQEIWTCQVTTVSSKALLELFFTQTVFYYTTQKYFFTSQNADRQYYTF
jgi:hypothetical protein